MDIYELINDNNINILKSVHKIKNYDYTNYIEVLDDVKENLINLYSVYRSKTGDIQGFSNCMEHVSQINKIKGSNDTEKIINLLENIINRQNNFKKDYISSNKVNDEGKDYLDITMELNYELEDMLYESYVDIMNSESNYISDLIYDLCDVNEAVGGAVKTTVKAANKTFKGAVKVWETILNFINKIKELFMSKIKKIQERDAEWLKQNKKTLMNINTENKEVNIHSDYAVPFSSSKSTMQNFRNMVKSNSKVTDYEVFKSKLTAFTTQDGDLKTGLTNKFRTGSTNKEYSIKTISGRPISNAIPVLIKFCEEYMNAVNDMNKEFKDSEAFVKQLKREMENRDIVMDSYCYIEDMYYNETDLGLYIDFDTVFEVDTGVNDNNQNNNQQNTNNDNTQQNKKEKVGVNNRDKVKEETSKMSDKQLKVYTKICSDLNLGLSCYLTTMEKKYFESMTILRGLIKE